MARTPCRTCGGGGRPRTVTSTATTTDTRALLAAARPAYAVDRPGRQPKRFSTLVAAQDYARRIGGTVRSL